MEKQSKQTTPPPPQKKKTNKTYVYVNRISCGDDWHWQLTFKYQSAED